MPYTLYITKLFGVDIQENRSRMQIVNNNTNDKQTSGASLALDEDSLMFVYFRSAAFIIVVTQKLVLQQSKNVTA